MARLSFPVLASLLLHLGVVLALSSGYRREALPLLRNPGTVLLYLDSVRETQERGRVTAGQAAQSDQRTVSGASAPAGPAPVAARPSPRREAAAAALHHADSAKSGSTSSTSSIAKTSGVWQGKVGGSVGSQATASAPAQTAEGAARNTGGTAAGKTGAGTTRKSDESATRKSDESATRKSDGSLPSKLERSASLRPGGLGANSAGVPGGSNTTSGTVANGNGSTSFAAGTPAEPVSGSASRTGTASARRSAYQARLKSLVEAHKQYPLAARSSGREGSCQRRFVLGRDGSLKRVEELSSCGHPFLDAAASRAITGVGKFPPLPEEFPGPEEGFTITMTFTLGKRE
jgi:TonB family protein